MIFLNKKVLVIASRGHLNLYKTGFLNYAKKNNLKIDFFIVDYPPKKNGLLHLLYKYNILNYLDNYYNNLRKTLLCILDNYDEVIFINLFFDRFYFIDDKIKLALKEKNNVLMFVDSIKSLPEEVKFFDIFNKIFSFEYSDIEYAKITFNINLKYIFIGTNYNLYKIIDEENEYDLCFVGLATPKRIEYLNKIAKYCNQNGKSFFCSGHFWHSSNFWNRFWGEIKFKKKHPILAKYVRNNFISPEDLAQIYKKSKICLNINVEQHKGFNPRNFDIMCIGSLLLTDEQDLNGIELRPNEDFIMSDSSDQMISDIDYYLKNSCKRDNIVQSGKQKVISNYLFENTLRKLI